MGFLPELQKKTAPDHRPRVEAFTRISSESMMIELAFVVCLRTMPDLCEERSISYLPDVTIMTCMMQAQPQLAQWSEAHPNLTIARWACQSADSRAVKA